VTKPSPDRLFEAIDATWPAARAIREGPWLLREGLGGGKRVSAATALGPVAADDIPLAEDAMRRLTQTPLFLIRNGENDLDAALALHGYEIIDPTAVMVLPVDALTDSPVPPVTAFTIWEPLAIMAEIWAQGGIGPARLDVMSRTAVKTAILARWNEKPAGVGFVAIDREIAMVHAVEVLPGQRRQGVAQWIMRQAAFWAREQGAKTLAVLCVRANTPAVSLYSALGFETAGHYHYRVKPRTEETHHG
jgi:GNAT superfamily N-acetyltransferase